MLEMAPKVVVEIIMKSVEGRKSVCKIVGDFRLPDQAGIDGGKYLLLNNLTCHVSFLKEVINEAKSVSLSSFQD